LSGKLKKYLEYYILLVFCACLSTAFAQDTRYIGSYHQKFDINTGASRDFVSLQDNQKKYKPNNPMSLKLGFSVKNSIWALSYGFKIGSTINDKMPKTKFFDFQLHHYEQKYIIDLYLQRYKGFYSDLFVMQPYPQMQVRQYGVEGAYLFNGERFSAKAAFAQSEKQLRSAGSIIAGTGTYFNQVDLGAGEKPVDNVQIGTSAGYAYSYVINESWLLSGALSGGINAGVHISGERKGKMVFMPNTLSRLSFSYNRENWTLALRALINTRHYSPFTSDVLNLNAGSLQLAFIWRFYETPVFVEKIIDKMRNYSR